MYDIIQILREAVEQEATFKVGESSFVNESEKIYKFTSCELNTYWLKPCMEVVFYSPDGVGKILSVENNKSITVQFPNTLVGDTSSFTIPAPSFVHGTVPFANIEISNIGIKNDDCEMPVSYLFELFTQKFLKREASNHFIAENLRIFFLDDYGINELTTSDHYENVIYPMQNFAFFVLDNLKKDIKRVDKTYIEDNSYKLINRVKTGVFKGTKGNEKSFFSRDLSGVELVLSLAIKKDNDCCDCC